LGWALITHPFHPLKGQRFAILKIRKMSGLEVLSLYDDKRGSLPIPRDWTDQALLSPHEGLIEREKTFNVRRTAHIGFDNNDICAWSYFVNLALQRSQ